MIFDKVELDEVTYDVTGQLRIKEDNEVKITFEDLMFGNTLKDLNSREETIDYLVLKSNEEIRYDSQKVKVSHLTIDGKFYHATFK
ncbi:hypothetical protein ACFOU0_09500 [Salinicoccus sesuvii]|uniref:Uncharacterized protein n=1 Tax=Salinicoccus sesuvii TaxID=868281 RepID=A0ABV7N6B0_9STAP